MIEYSLIKKSWPLVLSLVIGCTHVIYQPLPYMVQADISSLTEDQLLERFHWAVRGCVKSMTNPPQKDGKFVVVKADECTRASLSNDKAKVGKRLAELHPEWDKRLRTSIGQGVPFSEGMTEDQAVLLLGEPDVKNLTHASGLSRTQWVYRLSSNSSLYIYFQNGICTAYQL